MKQFALLIVLTAAGCNAPETSERIELVDTPWAVSGTLMSKTGAPIPNHEIEFVRIQPSKKPDPGQKNEAKTFAIVKTDSAGHFYFSSAVAGKYDVISWVEPPCVAHTSLGFMASQRISIKLSYTDKDCEIHL
jgi:hypothetical protein